MQQFSRFPDVALRDQRMRLGKILHGFLYQSEEIILQRSITLQIGFHLLHRLRTQHRIDRIYSNPTSFSEATIIGMAFDELSDARRIIHRFVLQGRETVVEYQNWIHASLLALVFSSMQLSSSMPFINPVHVSVLPRSHALPHPNGNWHGYAGTRYFPDGRSATSPV